MNVSTQNQDNAVGIQETTEDYLEDISFVITLTDVLLQNVCPCYKLMFNLS